MEEEGPYTFTFSPDTSFKILKIRNGILGSNWAQNAFDSADVFALNVQLTFVVDYLRLRMGIFVHCNERISNRLFTKKIRSTNLVLFHHFLSLLKILALKVRFSTEVGT